MVKKKFIDKKNAVTYSLVYRSTEDVDDVPERVLVEAEKGVGPGRVDAEVAAAAAAREAASGRRWACARGCAGCLPAEPEGCTTLLACVPAIPA